MPNKVLTIDKTTMALPEGQYFNAKQPKDLVVLHFTAGTTVSGAIQTWRTDPIAVGTAFLISTDGLIYQAFDPETWAYHLGIKQGDPTHRQDKRSIGIELVNVGPLRLKNGKELCFWPNNWGERYCFLNQPDRYVKADFRGEKYFAAFPVEQLEATARLVKHLCKTYGISTDVFRKGDVMQHKGIATHTDFRTDKFDIGPAFPWAVFESLLKPLPA